VCISPCARRRLGGGQEKDYKRMDSSSRFVPRTAFPLPPPPKLDKQANPFVAEDRRGTKAARGPNVHDRFRALRQYRCSRGLCEKCAEKWVHGHTCSPTVQLHAIQEMWELLPESTEESECDIVSNLESIQLCLCLSVVAVSCVESQKSMRLLGHIQGKGMMILLDSRSSNSFISSQLVAHLSGVSELLKPLLVKVASGAPMHCVSQLQQVAWKI
jgi:hypothetical protein